MMNFLNTNKVLYHPKQFFEMQKKETLLHLSLLRSIKQMSVITTARVASMQTYLLTTTINFRSISLKIYF